MEKLNMKWTDIVFDEIIRNSIFHFFMLKFNQFKQFNNSIANGNG